MVERIERLRQPERVLGEHREFQRSDNQFDDLVEARRLEHQSPELVAAMLAGQLGGRYVAQGVEKGGFVDLVALLHLLKDVIGPDDGVLDIRPALALEAQGLLEIERDY